jgi:GT2 family glycosyltransferase
MRYIRRSLPSLLDSELPDEARVIFVDDCSPNPNVALFLRHLAQKYKGVEIWRNSTNLGPNKGQEYNVPLVWKRFPEAPYIVCCDDDIVYHPGWLKRLSRVYEEEKTANLEVIYTAINVPARPHYGRLQLPTSEIVLKERQMALNWLISREVYEEIGPFRDAGIAYDSDYCNRMRERGLPVICLVPSYVQNIGYHGAYQHDDTYRARDFIGRLDAYLVARDCCYRLSRGVRNLVERVPQGRARELIKRLASPVRRALGI